MRLRSSLPASGDSLTKFASLISLALVASWSISRPALAGDLVVQFDQAQLLRLPRPAAEVIIGNPSIADVTLQGGNILAITGKTFGITNVIILDADRNVIQDQRILVERDERRMVNLLKGSTRFTFSCTPNCQPNLTPGDDIEFFGQISKHNSEKTKFSSSASESADAGGNAQ